jgi:transposase InsO family protein
VDDRDSKRRGCGRCGLIQRDEGSLSARVHPTTDRGVQYASGDYVRMLRKHQLIPSMSRPANPYDNASCESFMKTLKREEIYANDYRDLDHLRMNIVAFIDGYYNRCRLHSAIDAITA